jgi:hypothetical protein
MAVRHVLASLLVSLVALVALVDCGVLSSSCAPQENRPTAAACTVTTPPGATGSAPTSCATTADCHDPYWPNCVQGQCSFDTCLADSDCASGTLCACAGQFYGGNRFHGNECVAASCRVDADCGTGSICAPSRGYCGGFAGFHCVRARRGRAEQATLASTCRRTATSNARRHRPARADLGDDALDRRSPLRLAARPRERTEQRTHGARRVRDRVPPRAFAGVPLLERGTRGGDEHP